MTAVSDRTEDLFSVRDRVVVITGGLGQLGRQFTRTLTARGAGGGVFDRRAGGGPGDAPGGGRTVPVDVTRRESIAAGLRRVQDAWGTPHALINNAALDSPPGAPAEENGPFETYPEASFDRVLDVNVKGVFLCCQVVGGAMAEAGRGSVI